MKTEKETSAHALRMLGHGTLFIAEIYTECPSKEEFLALCGQYWDQIVPMLAQKESGVAGG